MSKIQTWRKTVSSISGVMKTECPYIEVGYSIHIYNPAQNQINQITQCETWDNHSATTKLLI